MCFIHAYTYVCMHAGHPYVSHSFLLPQGLHVRMSVSDTCMHVDKTGHPLDLAIK